jgi:transcriptional regulator with XRE-family HTH domain
MDLKEFGRRLQMVREDLLRMNQTEIAWYLNMSQTMYSRLESGMAGNIHTIFKVVNYLRHRNLEAHLMFHDEFDLKVLVKPDVKETQEGSDRERLLELLEHLKTSAKEDYENLTILREMVSRRP